MALRGINCMVLATNCGIQYVIVLNDVTTKVASFRDIQLRFFMHDLAYAVAGLVEIQGRGRDPSSYLAIGGTHNCIMYMLIMFNISIK